MSITRENFDEFYLRVCTSIGKSSFVSLDLEMTGINSFEKSDRIKKTDFPDDRFLKMIRVATKFSIIQIGLCCFCPDENNPTSFVAHPFTFYVFPEFGVDVVMSASSIDFLRKNGMDFNKWISKGVPFVNEREEDMLKVKFGISDSNEIKESTTESVTTSPPPRAVLSLTKPSDVEFMERQILGLNSMIQSDTEVEFVFEYANAFLRRAVFQYMETNHPDIIMTKTSDGKQCAKKMNDEEKEKHVQQKKSESTASYLSALGFRRVWKELIASKKPIVGHNCMYDLMFLCRWLDRPLPADFSTFKTRLSSLFPTVFDTKFIAESGLLVQKFGDTTLNQLYEKICPALGVEGHPQVPCRFAEGLDSYADTKSQQFHEAGYDAYCTGRIFTQELLELGGLSAIREVAGNRLFCTQSLFHLDLDPSRPSGWLKVTGAIVHIADFPTSTVTEDLFAPFTAAGLDRAQLEAIWDDDKNAFVVVASSTHSEDAVVAMLVTPEGWRMQAFQKYVEQRNAVNNPDPAATAAPPALPSEGEEPEAKRAKVV